MSIRHCIAGVVLVVAGALVVNAYQDPSESSSRESAKKLWQVQMRMRERERDVKIAQDELKELQVELQELERSRDRQEQVAARDVPNTQHVPTKATPSSSSVGRYQFVDQSDGPNGTRGMLIDTVTGHCWYRGTGTWQDAGNPTAPPARKDATPLGDLLLPAPPSNAKGAGTLEPAPGLEPPQGTPIP